MANKWNSRTSKSILQTLQVIGENIEIEAKEAINKGADMIINTAKTKINSKTGNLASSLKKKNIHNGATVRVIADAVSHKNNVAYASLVEFWPGREHPFLYNSYDEHVDEIKNSVIEAIRRGLKK